MSITYMELSDILWETGALLKLAKESNRRSSAFIKAAEFVEEWGDNIWDATREELAELPRITDEVLEAIFEIKENEHLILNKELRQRFGSKMSDLLRIQGIGRATALAMKDTLGINDLHGLKKAIQEKTILQVKGVGQRLLQHLEETVPKIEEELEIRKNEITASYQAFVEKETKEKETKEKETKEKETKEKETKEKVTKEKVTKEKVKKEKETKEKEKKEKVKKEKVKKEKETKEKETKEESYQTFTDEEESYQTFTDEEERKKLSKEISDDNIIRNNKQKDPTKSYDEIKDDEKESFEQGEGRTFEGVLRCPESGKGGFKISKDEAICEGSHYVVVHDILDILGDEVATSTWTQSVMEHTVYSHFYESLFRPKLTRFVTPRSIKRDIALSLFELKLEPDWVVLDLACGTGNYARAIAERLEPASGFVVAVDISWSMLKKASKLREEEQVSNLHLLRASGEHLPIMDASMDAAHCTGAFHLFSDKGQVLREFHRVLKKDGRLVIGTFLRSEWSFLKQVQEYSEHSLGFQWFEHDELIELIENFGFRVERVNIAGLAVTVTARRV